MGRFLMQIKCVYDAMQSHNQRKRDRTILFSLPSALSMPSSSSSSSSKIICLHVLFGFIFSSSPCTLNLLCIRKNSGRAREREKERKKGCESLKTKKKQSLWASHIDKEVRKNAVDGTRRAHRFVSEIVVCVSIKSVAVTMLVDSAMAMALHPSAKGEKIKKLICKWAKLEKKEDAEEWKWESEWERGTFAHFKCC